LVILFKVELTIGDELETFHETNYKNDEVWSSHYFGFLVKVIIVGCATLLINFPN
jgi:hypothetical protein